MLADPTRDWLHEAIHLLRASVRLARGDLSGAALDADRPLGSDTRTLQLALAAQVARSAGREAEAERLASELLELAPSWLEEPQPTNPVHVRSRLAWEPPAYHKPTEPAAHSHERLVVSRRARGEAGRFRLTPRTRRGVRFVVSVRRARR